MERIYHMKNFRIRVNVEIEECEQTELSNPAIGEDGRFAMTISEQEATSIDMCENALLRTCHPAIREAIRRHFTEISKKKPVE
jgi:hypothetical protein